MYKHKDRYFIKLIKKTLILAFETIIMIEHCYHCNYYSILLINLISPASRFLILDSKLLESIILQLMQGRVKSV